MTKHFFFLTARIFFLSPISFKKTFFSLFFMEIIFKIAQVKLLSGVPTSVADPLGGNQANIGSRFSTSACLK